MNFQTWRNKVLKMIKKSKRDHFISEKNENINYTRKLWKLINEITPSKVSTTPSSLELNGNVITNGQQIVETLYDFFSNIDKETKVSQYISNNKISQNPLRRLRILFLTISRKMLNLKFP